MSISWHCYSLGVEMLFPLCCWSHHFLLHPGTAGLVTQPFQSSTLRWRSQSGKRQKLWPLKQMPVCNLMLVLEISSVIHSRIIPTKLMGDSMCFKWLNFEFWVVSCQCHNYKAMLSMILVWRHLIFQTLKRGSINKCVFLLQWFVPAGFLSLFALVGTNGQGIGTR